MDPVISQLQAAGLLIDGMPKIGILTRCKVEGDKGTKASGWYVLHEVQLKNGDLVHVGRYGNWKTMGPESLQIKFDKVVDSYDRQRIIERQRELAVAAETEKKLKQFSAASRAAKIWDKLPQMGASDYLKRKRVPAYGLRFTHGSVVVPVRNINGDLVGLQFINGNGEKQFITGTAKQGAFHLIGTVDGSRPLCIAEGYATAATIHKIMGWPVAVAFDAGNLTPVAKALREKYQEQKILICADNDIATLGNPGVTKAKEAERTIGAVVAVPTFQGSEVAA
mgnify:CR=1 FL=1